MSCQLPTMSTVHVPMLTSCLVCNFIMFDLYSQDCLFNLKIYKMVYECVMCVSAQRELVMR